MQPGVETTLTVKPPVNPGQFQPGNNANPNGRRRIRTLEKISDRDLEKLEQMTKDQLVTLIKRCAAAVWKYALMDEDESYEAVCLKLKTMGLSEEQSYKALPPLKEWMDRRKGKPKQSIDMVVEDKGIGKLATDRLLALERELARVTGQEALVIAPPPARIDSDQG